MNTETQHKQSTILIVDDDPLTVSIVQEYLALAGFTDIHTVTNPQRVMQEIGERKPAMILLDIFMPEIDGLELLKQIKSRPELDEVIVLMLSSAEGNEKYKSLEMGAAGFIKKPVTEEISNHVLRAFNVAMRLGRLMNLRSSFDLSKDCSTDDSQQFLESF